MKTADLIINVAASLGCPRPPAEEMFGICTNACDTEDQGQPCTDEEFMCCPGVNGCANGCIRPVTVCTGPNEEVHQVGDNITATDGCNTWYAIIKVICYLL